METSTFRVTSETFRDGETLPDSTVFDGMGCTGGNHSPQLAWSGAPAGTQSYVLILWDPDAPTTVGFCHWIAYDISPETTSLDVGAGAKHILPTGLKHGYNDFGQSNYDGPCPPPGDPPHRYQFTVYALDVPKLTGASSGSTYAMTRFLMSQHTLATATITGRYGR